MTMVTDKQKVSTVLLPHQQRVVEEKVDLDTKMAKLLAFFDTKIYNDLPTEDRLLLIAQHTHMRAYSDTLGTRIARFSMAAVPDVVPVTIIPVKSSSLEGIGWQKDTLYVRFPDSSVWQYEGVPLSEFAALQTAPSVGKYFSQHIRNKYKAKKLS